MLLSRDEIKKALRFEGPSGIPKAQTLWLNREFRETQGEAVDALVRRLDYQDDTVNVHMGIDYWNAPEDDPTYRFAFGGRQPRNDVAIDARAVISDWSELDAFLAEFPDPWRPGVADNVAAARKAHPDRYVLCSWGHYIHQRLAYLRGIENLMLDLYDNSDQLRRVLDALLDFYEVWAVRAAEAGADGIWAGDDLGTQRSLFMSPEMFRDIYKPYYLRLSRLLHRNGLDFWMHSCGNITALMDDLVDIGVDAIHPIQAGTMDDADIARRYGGKIAFWIGMDVQQTLPFGTPGEVEASVAERIRCFYRPEGGLILASGNAIMPQTPMANIEAYLKTLKRYSSGYQDGSAEVSAY